MTSLSQKIKKHLPKSIKTILRPFYHNYLILRHKWTPKTYAQQVKDEIHRFSTVEEVNDLPDIFHYWSNKYLAPKFQQHGFSNPNDFFLKNTIKSLAKNNQPTSILSIGAGNCDSEILLAEQLIENGHHNFVIDCMDINEAMFQRGQNSANEKNVSNHLAFIQADFNSWKAGKKYHLIMANQCLHHVVELEHLFDNIHLALTDEGRFITSDVIGRNGHQRWPEALNMIKPIWKSMPSRYQYNHSTQRTEKKYLNHDCSTEGFEGIRAQDILPLLVDRFQFELFIPFANLVLVFIDRTFGPNFDVNHPEDLSFIDYIHELDERSIDQGVIKPTQMLAVMNKQATCNRSATTQGSNPKNFLRKTN